MSSTTSTYFLRLNNSEAFVELVGARSLHLLSQTVLPLKSPTGAFIAALRFANAVPPQTLLRTDEEELCQFDTIPPTIERNRASPMGERPAVHISVVCGFFRVRPIQGAPCFCFIAVGCTSNRITATPYRFLPAPARTIRCRCPHQALPLPDERTSNRVQHRASA